MAKELLFRRKKCKADKLTFMWMTVLCVYLTEYMYKLDEYPPTRCWQLELELHQEGAAQSCNLAQILRGITNTPNKIIFKYVRVLYFNSVADENMSLKTGDENMALKTRCAGRYNTRYF